MNFHVHVYRLLKTNQIIKDHEGRNILRYMLEK